MPDLSSKQVRVAMKAAIAKAEEIGSACSIAIVDAGRNLVSFHRMDDAILASIEIAQGKAYTARSLNMKTGDLAPLVQPGGPFYGFETSHRVPLVVFGGGYPIEAGGGIFGAIGVAGGSFEQDEAVAEAALAIFAG